MNPWYAKGVVLAATAAMIAIRAPHGHRSRTVKVVRSAKGVLENVLLLLAWIGFFVPLVWIWSSAFESAEFELRPAALVAGSLLYAIGLWLFHRSHADLGTNWSVTLQVRENHRLVTEGVYRRIRHPMYSGLLLFSLGQAVTVPNWIAGPSYLVVMVLLVALRLGPEEGLMRGTFGARYDAYVRTTKRLVPGVW
ncbi:MAG: protein-S-isoprenylcysteine O-methyltransferase [Planctomycetota bacterium]|nr:protein-S-isoprenylcysteine O-methyltransferase [Planctomycetota bacterium]